MFNQWFRRKRSQYKSTGSTSEMIPLEKLLDGLDTNLEIDDFENFWQNYVEVLHSTIVSNILNQKETTLITILGVTQNVHTEGKVISFSIPFANVEPHIAKEIIINFGSILEEEQYG